MKNKDDDVKKEEKPIYYHLYKLLVEALKQNNPHAGLEKAMTKIQKVLDSDYMKLYKFKNNDYECIKNISKEQYNYDYGFYNLESDLIFDIYKKKEINKSKRMDVQLVNGKSNVTFLPINCKNGNKYILYVINNKLKHDEEYEEVMNSIEECFDVVLTRKEQYDKLMKLSYEDNLTKLENRTSYNEKIKRIKASDKLQHVTYTLIDLFRLKYVNDNINHEAGDIYIEETAKILKKYFPESINGKPTGDTVYRIGGDEFSIISLYKTSDQVKEILKFANEEVSNIDVNSDLETILAINYGVSETYNNANIENLYKLADEKLKMYKTKMYLENNIERRR